MNISDIKIVVGSSIISIFLGAAGGAAISDYRHNNPRNIDSDTSAYTGTRMDLSSMEREVIQLTLPLAR